MDQLQLWDIAAIYAESGAEIENEKLYSLLKKRFCLSFDNCNDEGVNYSPLKWQVCANKNSLINKKTLINKPFRTGQSIFNIN